MSFISTATNFSVSGDNITQPQISNVANVPIYNAAFFRNMELDPDLQTNTSLNDSIIWNGTRWIPGSAAGTGPVFLDTQFRVRQAPGPTVQDIAFNCDNISTGFTREFWSPDANGVLPATPNFDSISIVQIADTGRSILGTNSTFVGSGSLAVVSTGANQTGFGAHALESITTGAQNTAVGSGTLADEQLGTSNCAMGFATASTLVGASRNTALGTAAMQSSGAGAINDVTAVGYQCLKFCSANGAVAVGSQAGSNISSGTGNVAVGQLALGGVTTSTNNTAVGHFAGQNLNTSFNTAVGSSALNAAAGGSCTAVGYHALTVNTAASNTAVGCESLAANTTGTENTAVGVFSLFANTTGLANTTLGNSCLDKNISGNFNVAIGSITLSDLTSGSRNIGIGRSALQACETGSENVSIGVNALQLSNSFGNIAIGFDALKDSLTGNNNIVMGSSAGSAYVGAETGNILIGDSGDVGDNNSIRIGRGKANCYIGGITGTNVGAVPAVVVTGSSQLGINLSSRRYKWDISPLDAGMVDKVLALNPVTFRYLESADNNALNFGLIAEEVAEILPEFVYYQSPKDDPEGPVVPETVLYQFLAPALISVCKGLKAEVAALRTQISDEVAALRLEIAGHSHA
jgi:hypothetical protein